MYKRGAFKNIQLSGPKNDSAPNHPPQPPGIPVLGNLVQARRNPLRFALDLTRDFGDITRFRIGTYTGYLLNHPRYFQYVLKTNHRNYNKDNYNYRKLKTVLGEGLITANGDEWYRDRQLISPAFHGNKIERFCATTTKAAGEMLERWQYSSDHLEPVNIASEMMKLTLRVIADSLFSMDIRSSVYVVAKAFSTLNEDISYRFKTVFVPPLWIPTRRNRAFKKALVELDRLVYEIIKRRRNEEISRNDLLDMLIAAGEKQSGEGMTDREIRDEVLTLMLAGHETTANLLSWTIFLLSQNPNVMDKLTIELKEVLNTRDPVYGDLSELNFTKKVLQESLRLYPPVWIISRNAIKDDFIGGYRIPAGSTVTLCSYTLHRHPGFWENPETFNPERFSSDQSSHYAYFPFGGGPRSCIGSHFAIMEAQLILAMIFRRYKLKLMPGHPVEPEPLITLKPRNGLRMIIESQ